MSFSFKLEFSRAFSKIKSLFCIVRDYIDASEFRSVNKKKNRAISTAAHFYRTTGRKDLTFRKTIPFTWPASRFYDLSFLPGGKYALFILGERSRRANLASAFGFYIDGNVDFAAILMYCSNLGTVFFLLASSKL